MCFRFGIHLLYINIGKYASMKPDPIVQVRQNIFGTCLYIGSTFANTLQWIRCFFKTLEIDKFSA